MRLTPRQIQAWLRFATIEDAERGLETINLNAQIYHAPDKAAKQAKILERYLCRLE